MNKMLNGVLVAMTDEEIAESNALKASIPTEEERWLENRMGEYPSLQECIHAILDDELDALQAKRAAVKAKYPKS